MDSSALLLLLGKGKTRKTANQKFSLEKEKKRVPIVLENT